MATERTINLRYDDGISTIPGESYEFGFDIRYREELGAQLPIEVVEERLKDALDFAIKRVKDVREKQLLETIYEIA